MVLRGAQGLATKNFGGEVERTIAKIQTGKPVEPPARELARTVLRGSGDGGEVALAGVVAADEAVRAGVRTPNGRIWLSRAIADLRRGLAAAPSDGFAWFRLAGAQYLLNGPGAEPNAAMRMGAYTIRSSPKASPLFLTMVAAMGPAVAADVKETAIATVQRQWKDPVWGKRFMRPLVFTASGQQLLRDALGPAPDLETWIAEELARKKRELDAKKRLPIRR